MVVPSTHGVGGVDGGGGVDGVGGGGGAIYTSDMFYLPLMEPITLLTTQQNFVV